MQLIYRPHWVRRALEASELLRVNLPDLLKGQPKGRTVFNPSTAALINERLRLAASSGCKFAISAAGWGSQSEGNLTKSGFAFLSEGYNMQE